MGRKRNQFHLTFLSLLTIVYLCDALRCPSPDWYYRKSTDKCYFVQGSSIEPSHSNPRGVMSTAETWVEAVADCQIRGGKLVTFETAEELEWVKAKLLPTKSYWIGLSYQNLIWEWNDGTTSRPYTTLAGLNVPSGPPSFFPTTAKQRYRGALQYSQNDNKFQFSSVLITALNTKGYICKGNWSTRPWCRTEQGWTYRDGKCYRYTPWKTTYMQAEDFCLTNGGFLLVPSTMEEDNQIKRWLRDVLKVDKAWLGVSIRPKNSTTTVDTVKWADGTALMRLPINNWETSTMPTYLSSLTDGVDYCGELTSGITIEDFIPGVMIIQQMHDWALVSSCSADRPFVCESTLNRCPYGWTEFDDQCYQVNAGLGNLKSWTDAQQNCALENAKLVVINSERQQKFLRQAVNQKVANKFWIGLEAKGTSYGWVDNSPLTFTSWNFATDTTTTTGFCVFATMVDGVTVIVSPNYVTSFTQPFVKWNVTVCTERLNYVCQAHYTAVIPPDVVIHPEHTCAAPFEKYHEGCYLVVKAKKNRDAAQAHCQAQQNSVLAIIRLPAENTWLQDRVTEDSWIGFRIIETNTISPTNPLTRISSMLITYEYSNGDLVAPEAYRNLNDSISLNESKTFGRFCVAFAGKDSQFTGTTSGKKIPRGQWYRAACTEERAFVCSHDGAPLPVPPTHDSVEDPACGAGWFRNGRDCYRFHNDYQPWRLAKQTCQNADPTADLVWISTKEEELFIRYHIEGNRSLFGISDDNMLGGLWESFWIGFYAEPASFNWYWSHQRGDNQWRLPVAVTNWRSGEPQTTDASKPQCAYIAGSDDRYGLSRRAFDGQWISTTCDERLQFICKKKLLQRTTIGPTMDPTQMCKEGWININGHCFHVNENFLSWADARSFCRGLSGDLISIHGDREFENINSFVEHAWIGLNALEQMDNPRVFRWSDGTHVSYTPWANQTNSMTNDIYIDANCVTLSSKGFAVRSCSKLRTSVCGSRIMGIITTASNEGRSGSHVAGIVIGVLLAVALLVGLGYMVMTRKTQFGIATVRSAGSRFKTNTTNGVNNAALLQELQPLA